MSLVTDHDETPNPTPSQPAGSPVSADRVWEMIASIDIAMLVTRWSQGLRGRPMSTIPTPEKGLIYILTEMNSPAAKDIGDNDAVFLSYQGRGDHVALQGKARVNPDKGLVKDLWNPGAELYWPNGPEAHDVVVLEIDPGHADVWDGPGLIGGIASIVSAAVQRRPPDMGERGEVDL